VQGAAITVATMASFADQSERAVKPVSFAQLQDEEYARSLAAPDEVVTTPEVRLAWVP
jgi:hypothetical protein